ncbi:hypothetical protein ACLKA6_013653 [Drosophila palustris]
MRRQRETTMQQGEQQQREEVLRNLTPYDVMRLQNCKSFKFRKGEMYPSIRPPVSQCNPAQTVALLSDTMAANGCGPIDATLLDQSRPSPYADRAPKNEKKLENLHVEFPCRDKKRKLQEQVLSDPEMAEKWSKLTPNELIRMHNCKTHFYQNGETYPSIRPTLYRCSVAKTAEALVDALEDNCCGRPFDMEQDDIMEVWKQSPHKNTLSFYGIGSTGIPQPEAIVFNRVMAQCLEKVNAPEPLKEEIPRPKKSRLPKESRICGNLVLNRPLLAVKISKMPTVQQKLNVKHIHCPRPAIKSQPFSDNSPKTEPAKSVKSVRKIHYCDLKCGIPENKCTALEWMKYQGDPQPYEAAFEREMAEMEAEVEPEPRNYDELYEELITCFEADSKADPLCEIYKKCCTKLKPEDEEEEGGAGGAGGAGGTGGKKKPKPDDGKTGKDKTGKDKTGKDKTGKDKDKPGQDEDKRDKSKPGKGKPSKDKAGKEADEANESEGKDKAKDKDKDKDKNKDKWKQGESGSDIETGKKTKVPNYESDEDKKQKPTTDVSKAPSVSGISTADKSDAKLETEQPVEGQKKPPKPPKKTGQDKPGTRGDKPSFYKKPTHHHKPAHGINADKSDAERQPPPPKDCPCEICEFMKRRDRESDTPLIRQMKLQEKRRKLRVYYTQMCQRQRDEKCAAPELRAPLHKCDPIECDDSFCHNPKLAEYSDCLRAMHELQKLLGPKHRIVDNELVFNLDQLEDLRRRVCRRFCACL